MRSAIAFYGLLAAMLVAAPAEGSECPGNAGALGTSRTIVVDPTEHNLLGGFQYRESLPLNHKEVVLTFDDGPLPPYSTRILDQLARECVKATFFMVGRMARAYPKIVQRVYEEGHTLANHSQSHPFNFHTMSIADAAREIDDGFESIAAAAGDPAKVAPFFRFPGLLRQESIERYLASRQVMTWSVDFMADDWRRISAREIVARALDRLEAKGKGILLLHDIQPATALALPDLLAELKARGYRVVHVVPASAERPATVATADQWVIRHARPQVAEREPNVWLRVLAQQVRATAPSLVAPSVMSFGADSADGDVPVTLVSAPETLPAADGDSAASIAWPPEVITIAALPEFDRWPAPAADHFRYRQFMRNHVRTESSRPNRETARPEIKHHKRDITHSVNADITGSIPGHTGGEPKAGKAAHAGNKGRKGGKARNVNRPEIDDPIGHQIQLSLPQASLAAPKR
jgi:peptidoglycan/xylan/chitin deacetylase (PgdA/CDA1 family)